MFRVTNLKRRAFRQLASRRLFSIKPGDDVKVAPVQAEPLPSQADIVIIGGGARSVSTFTTQLLTYRCHRLLDRVQSVQNEQEEGRAARKEPADAWIDVARSGSRGPAAQLL